MAQVLNHMGSYLCNYVESLTQKSENGFYICPICGSGNDTHKNGSFNVTDDGLRWQCFSCKKTGDIFDLYGEVNKCGLSEAAREVIAQCSYNTGVPHARLEVIKNSRKENPCNYDAELLEYHKALKDSPGETYLLRKGFSLDTINRFNLGYDTAKKTIIIPFNQEGAYFFQRSIQLEYEGPRNALSSIKMPLFNAAALDTSSACFIVKCPLCAMSISQEGGAAVAICNIDGKDRLLEQLKMNPTRAALILCFDNDELGQKAAEEIATELAKENHFYVDANIAGDYKNANERLQHDKDGLRAAISSTTAEAIKAQKIEVQAEKKAYESLSAASCIDAFTDDNTGRMNTTVMQTGFFGLDTLLNGGFYEGLYIIKELNGIGETTFAMQIADQIATDGHDVVILTRDMTRYELMAKSLSRLTYKLALEREIGSEAAKTTIGITATKRYVDYSEKEKQLIEDAIKYYRQKISKHLWILECEGDINVKMIKGIIEKHIGVTGRKPVVFMDYLLTNTLQKEQNTDNKNIEKAMLDLRRLSRNNKIPIIGISSSDYAPHTNLSTPMENCAIEYYCDELLCLQFSGMDYDEEETDKARERKYRELIKNNERAVYEGKGVEMVLRILKHRDSCRGNSCLFTYYPMFNCFVEHKTDEKPPVRHFSLHK